MRRAFGPSQSFAFYLSPPTQHFVQKGETFSISGCRHLFFLIIVSRVFIIIFFLFFLPSFFNAPSVTLWSWCLWCFDVDLHSSSLLFKISISSSFRYIIWHFNFVNLFFLFVHSVFFVPVLFHLFISFFCTLSGNMLLVMFYFFSFLSSFLVLLSFLPSLSVRQHLHSLHTSVNNLPISRSTCAMLTWKGRCLVKLFNKKEW